MRTFTSGQAVVQAEGHNVRHLVNELDQLYPGLKDAMMFGDRLKPHILVAIDGQVTPLGALQPLDGIREVTFLPSMSGG
jgi:hypothetical protein